MTHDPTNDNNPLGDGTPDSLDALQEDGVLSVSGPDAEDADAFALAIAGDIEAYDAALVERDGPEAMTSDRLVRLAEFKRRQAAERRADLQRAERDSDLIGFVIGAMRRQRTWTPEDLADWLGIGLDDLGRLAVEQRPRALDYETLLYDPEPINEIADRHGAHRERLYEVFSQGDL